MKKRTRVIIIAAGLFAALLGAGIALLPALVALNQVKAEIAERLSQATGRSVTIKRMSLALYPWLGIRLDGATLGNAPGFGRKPFAQVDDVLLEVRVLPLFARHIVLRRIVLTGLRLNLEKARSGLSNWASLTHHAGKPPRRPVPAPHPHEPPALALVRAAGIAVTGATVRYRNLQTGSDYEVSRFSIRSGVVRPGAPVALRLSGRLHLGVRPPIPFRVRVRAVYRAPTLTLAPLHVDVAGLVVTGHLTATHAADGFHATGALTIPPFAPRPVLAALHVAYVPRDPKVLTRVAGAFSFALTPRSLQLAPLHLTVDGTAVSGHIARTAHPLLYKAHLVIGALRPLPYLPAPSASSAAVPAPIPASGATSGAAQLPLQANLLIQSLRVHGLTATQVHARIQASGGTVDAQPLTLGLYGGTFVGGLRARLGGHQRPWRLHAQLQNVDITALLRALHLFPEFAGRLDADTHLTGRGLTLAEAERTASGQIYAAIPQGSLRGLDLDFIARDPRAAVGNHKAKKVAGTTFSHLHASATVAQGIVHLHALSLRTSRAVIRGQGDVTLVTRAVNLLLNVALPSGLVVPVRVHGSPGHMSFGVSLNRLLGGSSPRALGSAVKSLGNRLEHLFGGH